MVRRLARISMHKMMRVLEEFIKLHIANTDANEQTKDSKDLVYIILFITPVVITNCCMDDCNYSCTFLQCGIGAGLFIL